MLENRMVIDSQWPDTEPKVAFRCDWCGEEIYLHDADCVADDCGNRFCCDECAESFYGIKRFRWEDAEY